MNIVPKDVILLPEMTPKYPDRWVALNVFARTCVGINSEVVGFLGRLDGGVAEPLERYFQCWEIERFSNEDGLTADPSRYQRDVGAWKELLLRQDELLAWLAKHFIVIEDETTYARRFADKSNVLDKEHFGNFHQQHGQHMLLVRRADPARWWMAQKFTPDYKEVRKDNLYGAVQSSYLREYFPTRLKKGMRVIDIGCGTGVYTGIMAACGADVLGIDPSDDYLAVARESAGQGAVYQTMNIGEPGGMASIPDASADWIFMSDALLFYFRPFYPGQKADIQVLLQDIRRILKPGGTFVSMEPHAAFYLTPWLGAVERPFTVVTEYLNKWFGIVPSLSWLMDEFSRAGFGLKNLLEMKPASYFKDIDPRAYRFAREFPMWQLLELGLWR